MPRISVLCRRQMPHRDGGRLGVLLLWGLLLLGLAPAARAQPGAPVLADYQRRLRTVRFDRRYWDARNDSLRRVLASQRADTLRLQTLTQLFHLTDLSQEALPDLLAEHREALRLATRLGYPEQKPLRQVVTFDELAWPRPPTCRPCATPCWRPCTPTMPWAIARSPTYWNGLMR